MRREPAGAFDAGDVASVPYSAAGPSTKSVEAAVGAGFARRPGVGQSGTPVGVRGSRPQPSSGSLAGSAPPAVRAGAGSRSGGGHGNARLGAGEAGPPERREDLVGAAAAGLYRPGLEHEVGLVARGVDAPGSGPTLQPGIDAALGSAVAAVPQQGAGRCLRGELPDDPVGRASAEHQPRARGLQRGAELGQGVVEPPLRGTAQGPDAGGFSSRM